MVTNLRGLRGSVQKSIFEAILYSFYRERQKQSFEKDVSSEADEAKTDREMSVCVCMYVCVCVHLLDDQSSHICFSVMAKPIWTHLGSFER